MTDTTDYRRYQMAAKNARGESVTMSSNILNKIMFMAYHLQKDGWFGTIGEMRPSGDQHLFSTIHSFPDNSTLGIHPYAR